MKLIASILFLGALAGCSDPNLVRDAPNKFHAPTEASEVQVLHEAPQRPYELLGVVSADRYKPGWTDPNLSDPNPELQAAGARLGADAVVVRSGRSLQIVEGDAIKYVKDGRTN